MRDVRRENEEETALVIRGQRIRISDDEIKINDKVGMSRMNGTTFIEDRTFEKEIFFGEKNGEADTFTNHKQKRIKG